MRAAHWIASVAVAGLTLATLGCAAAPQTVTPASTGSPRIAIDPERRDLGVVGLGEDAVAEYVVRNDGGAPLTLAMGPRSRGSRVEGLVPELPPGRSIRLRFSIDTFEGDGERVQGFALLTNDPARPRVPVEADVEVRPFLVARPGYVRYNVVQHAREGTITQTITSLDGAKFKVLRVESPVPTLRLSFREASAEERTAGASGSQWKVMSTLRADSPVGALQGYIVAHTDHPRQKRAFVPLSGFVRPILAVTPPEAKVGELDRKRSKPLRLVVKNFAEEEIEVSGVSTDVAVVKVALETVERGRSWSVTLLPVPDAPLGAFQGKIVLRTASPKVPLLEVPLSGQLVD